MTTDISEYIWNAKYRYAGERGIKGTWRRVARALARVEGTDARRWEQRFVESMKGFKVVPGGRILAGADRPHDVTMLNCFVMGPIEDSMEGIFEGLREGAVTMQKGGGVGYDFSTLRPFGTRAHTSGTIASGPVSFMHVWDSMCATVMSTDVRRGAMMATMRCDHPDIEAFVEAKRDGTSLRHFNLSVLVTDAFMDAVRKNAAWELVFPKHRAMPAQGKTIRRTWSGDADPTECLIYRKVQARALWDKMMHAAYDAAEPGVLFVDRINRLNNLWYREQITTTNPCGEVPLPPYGACCLGSINLTRFVKGSFGPDANVDFAAIDHAARVATRMLDNVIDVSHYPLEKQALQAKATRRIGLGITGLADALIMLGHRYDDESGRAAASNILRTITHAAYRTSVELAREKGPFPDLDRERYLSGPFVLDLPEDIRSGIREHGIRNSHLIAIAPAGSISLLAGNVSSGIEPLFGIRQVRRILEPDGTEAIYELTDYAYARWLRKTGGKQDFPETFVDAWSIQPESHLKMQAALQRYVDNSISKTVNVPENLPFERFRTLYEDAYDMGLKGCTTYRRSAAGAVTQRPPAAGEAVAGKPSL